MSLSFRVAQADEAATVHRITQAAFAEYAGTLPIIPLASRESLADVQAAVAEGRVVLAAEAGADIGTARFRLFPDHIYVERLAVLPAQRRTGVGAAIMAYMEDQAQRRGLPEVRLWTRTYLAGNIRFYSRLGYTIVPGPGDETAVWFAKQVPPAP